MLTNKSTITIRLNYAWVLQRVIFVMLPGKSLFLGKIADKCKCHLNYF